MRRLSLTAVFTFASLFSACEPQKVEPILQLTPSPRTIDGIGQKSNIRIFAVDDTGQPGTGSVKVTSSQGSLKDGESVTLSEGAGVIEFECSRGTEPSCLGKVDFDAEWSVAGKIVTATSSLTIAPPPPPDGGITLTTSRAALGIGLGQRADLTATYFVDGAPQANATINFTTTPAGQLQAMDGSLFSSGTTDFAGQVHAYLADTGLPGTAIVTANGPMGKAGVVSVNVYQPDAGIDITSDRSTITVGFNEFATLTVTHQLEGRGVAGRPIVIDSTAGRLRTEDGGVFPSSPLLTDANGKIVVQLTDMGAAGAATVTATDPANNKSDSTVVQIAQPDVGVSVTTDRNRLYVGVNGSVGVTARLVTNGAPAANRPLEVETSLGVLWLPDGGTFTGTGTTNAAGALALTLRETGTDGTATITAKDPDTMRTGTAVVNIVRVGTINHTATNCGGSACTLMGVANSGFNTQAQVRFTLNDATTPPQPVAGVGVTFALNNAPTGTTLAANSAVSDASGNVVAVVNSGNSIGSFTITATVLPGISATSPTIGVRGAKATNAGMSLACAKTNLPVYRSSLPPADITTNCDITLVDRNNNPVGNGTTVQLLTEAGNLPSSASTTAYVPNGTNEGRATVPFRTNLPFPVVDVDPLPADPAQYPFARVAEPNRADGALTRNPRDGLVALVVYTDGEEWFADTNGNGVQDGNEQFYDQGEPFVDANDNDICDGNENYIDVDNNMAWTPPNGVWNGTAKVWTKTYVLYTDAVLSSVASASPNPFSVPKDTTIAVDFFGLDRNLNVVEAPSALSFTRTGTRGLFIFEPETLQDSFGFGLTARQLTNQSATGPCNASTSVCIYRTVFRGWSAGKVGTVRMTGVPATDMTPGQAVTATVRVTTQGAPVDITASGVVQ